VGFEKHRYIRVANPPAAGGRSEKARISSFGPEKIRVSGFIVGKSHPLRSEIVNENKVDYFH